MGKVVPDRMFWALPAEDDSADAEASDTDPGEATRTQDEYPSGGGGALH
jgi:hypothetical protein